MIVFSAIIPHSPLLIPEIGKDNLDKLTSTTDALHILSDHFYAAFPDTLIIISPHGTVNENSFILNFAPQFIGNFSEFGYVHAQPKYYGDNELSYKIKSHLKMQFPLQLTTIEDLDYGTLVPLHYLLSRNKNVKILPISPADKLSMEEHFNFGRAINDELLDSSKRIAVIASVETSNKLSKISPAGYEPEAQKFDEKIINMLQKKNTPELLSVDKETIMKFGLTELHALLLFLGIMSPKNYTPHKLSYESPFGIGHIVMEYEL